MYRTLGCSIGMYHRLLPYADMFRCIQQYAGFAQDPLLGAENQGGLPKSDRILDMLCEKVIVLQLWRSAPEAFFFLGGCYQMYPNV